MGEPLRAGRLLNVLLGLLVAVSPWIADSATTAGRVNGLIVGLLVAALAFPRGLKSEEYGLWERWVF